MLPGWFWDFREGFFLFALGIFFFLKTTDTYCLMVLEAQSPKSRCLQGCASSETCRGTSLCLLLARGGLLAVFGSLGV